MATQKKESNENRIHETYYCWLSTNAYKPVLQTFLNNFLPNNYHFQVSRQFHRSIFCPDPEKVFLGLSIPWQVYHGWLAVPSTETAAHPQVWFPIIFKNSVIFHITYFITYTSPKILKLVAAKRTLTISSNDIEPVWIEMLKMWQTFGNNLVVIRVEN